MMVIISSWYLLWSFMKYAPRLWDFWESSCHVSDLLKLQLRVVLGQLRGCLLGNNPIFKFFGIQIVVRMYKLASAFLYRNTTICLTMIPSPTSTASDTEIYYSSIYSDHYYFWHWQVIWNLCQQILCYSM